MLIWSCPFPSNLLSNSYLHPGAFSNHINKGKPLKFLPGVPRDVICLWDSSPAAFLPSDTQQACFSGCPHHWHRLLSVEVVPFQKAAQARRNRIDSWNCIPSCETLLLMVCDYYFFLLARCLFYSQWSLLISLPPAIPLAIIHYNIFESCCIVVSNIS